MRRGSAYPAAVLAACLLVSVFATTVSSQDAAWLKEMKGFREERVTILRAPDGWLSLVGLEWLQPGDTSVGSAADNKVKLSAAHPAHLGIFRLENDRVTLLPPKEGFPAGLTVGGAPAKEQILRADPDDDRNSPHLLIGSLNLYAIRREGRFALRVKDSRSPSLVNFHDLIWYPPNAGYRVTAKWMPYVPQKTISLLTLVGTNHPAPVPGAAEFLLEGKTYRVEPVLETPDAKELFFILRDTTSTTTTYSACRFLYTSFPSNGLDKPGELVLDFNKLRNPPCAYTPYATCPLPPPGNKLPIPLPVGERRYHE